MGTRGIDLVERLYPHAVVHVALSVDGLELFARFGDTELALGDEGAAVVGQTLARGGTRGRRVLHEVVARCLGANNGKGTVDLARGTGHLELEARVVDAQHEAQLVVDEARVQASAQTAWTTISRAIRLKRRRRRRYIDISIQGSKSMK